MISPSRSAKGVLDIGHIARNNDTPGGARTHSSRNTARMSLMHVRLRFFRFGPSEAKTSVCSAKLDSKASGFRGIKDESIKGATLAHVNPCEDLPDPGPRGVKVQQLTLVQDAAHKHPPSREKTNHPLLSEKQPRSKHDLYPHRSFDKRPLRARQHRTYFVRLESISLTFQSHGRVRTMPCHSIQYGKLAQVVACTNKRAECKADNA